MEIKQLKDLEISDLEWVSSVENSEINYPETYQVRDEDLSLFLQKHDPHRQNSGTDKDETLLWLKSTIFEAKNKADDIFFKIVTSSRRQTFEKKKLTEHLKQLKKFTLKLETLMHLVEKTESGFEYVKNFQVPVEDLLNTNEKDELGLEYFTFDDIKEYINGSNEVQQNLLDFKSEAQTIIPLLPHDESKTAGISHPTETTLSYKKLIKRVSFSDDTKLEDTHKVLTDSQHRSKNSGQRRSAEGEKPHGKKGTKRSKSSTLESQQIKQRHQSAPAHISISSTEDEQKIIRDWPIVIYPETSQSRKEQDGFKFNSIDYILPFPFGIRLGLSLKGLIQNETSNQNLTKSELSDVIAKQTLLPLSSKFKKWIKDHDDKWFHSDQDLLTTFHSAMDSEFELISAYYLTKRGWLYHTRLKRWFMPRGNVRQLAFGFTAADYFSFNPNLFLLEVSNHFVLFEEDFWSNLRS